MVFYLGIIQSFMHFPQRAVGFTAGSERQISPYFTGCQWQHRGHKQFGQRGVCGRKSRKQIRVNQTGTLSLLPAEPLNVYNSPPSCPRSHQYTSGYYRVSAYFLALMIGDLLPMRTAPAIIFSCISYWMIGKELMLSLNLLSPNTFDF